jgi:hypothetical protein
VKAPNRKALRQRAGWLVAGVIYVAGCAWMLWADRMPWVVPLRRFESLNEFLAGGFRDFPVMFVLLWLFGAAMALHCFKRYSGKANEASE